VTPGDQARDTNRVLVRLGPAVGKEEHVDVARAKLCQLLPQALHIILQEFVLYRLVLREHLFGVLLAHLHVLLFAEQVEARLSAE
jgi:hypothetical protein